MLTPERRLQQLRAYLQNQRQVQAAYLFGSAARDTMGPLSDVDIAVLLNGDATSWHQLRLKLMEGLAWIFSVPRVDVVVLNTAEPVLAHRAIYEGFPVYVRDEEARIRFERRALRGYLDTSYLRRVQRAFIREQVGGGEYFG